jgi:hypothetical protein
MDDGVSGSYFYRQLVLGKVTVIHHYRKRWGFP